MNAARDRADPALDGKVVGPAGPTPLQAARAKGNAECVAVLLELGASETGARSQEYRGQKKVKTTFSKRFSTDFDSNGPHSLIPR